jgi:glycine/D-amino acid oxidase-like deaminating enzyme
MVAKSRVVVIGGGFAGAEAAYQAARRGADRVCNLPSGDGRIG